MNNAAQWAIVEETLPAEGSRRGLAEVEHVAAVDADGAVDLVTSSDSDGVRSSWITSDGAVLTAARWSPAR